MHTTKHTADLRLRLQSSARRCATARARAKRTPVRSTASKQIPVRAYAGMAVWLYFLDSNNVIAGRSSRYDHQRRKSRTHHHRCPPPSPRPKRLQDLLTRLHFSTRVVQRLLSLLPDLTPQRHNNEAKVNAFASRPLASTVRPQSCRNRLSFLVATASEPVREISLDTTHVYAALALSLPTLSVSTTSPPPPPLFAVMVKTRSTGIPSSFDADPRLARAVWLLQPSARRPSIMQTKRSVTRMGTAG